MVEQRFYDTVDNSWLIWRPLEDTSWPGLTRGLGDQGIMKAGAFGTCGNPKKPDYTSWRWDTLIPVFSHYNLGESDAFIPELEKWNSTRAPIESIHLARDEVLAIPVTNQTEGQASTMEAGFCAYGGILRGQDVTSFIELNEGTPERAKVPRLLAKSVLTATAAQYPVFSLADNLPALCHRTAISLSERIKQRNSGIETRTTYTPPPLRVDMDPTIYLSGTSGKNKPVWMDKVLGVIKEQGVSADDSYRTGWDSSDVDAELMHKLGNGVHLIGITGETDSLGALAELGPRLMYAHLSGQSLGVYIEKHDATSDTAANRTRTLAKAHLNRLLEDFPNLPVLVARDLKQLAIFGVSEHFRQKQRLSQ